MRFWKRPPKLGTLEEVTHLAVQSWEDQRRFMDHATVALAAAMPDVKDKDKKLSQIFKNLQNIYFGEEEETKSDQSDIDRLDKFVGKYGVKIKPDFIDQSLAPGKQKLKKKVVYMADPKGEDFF